MLNYVSGLISGGFLVGALFFFRFWRRTGDLLFAIFGVSFILFALSQGSMLLTDSPREDRAWIYMLRLLGFALLLAAIVWKNFDRRGSQRPPL